LFPPSRTLTALPSFPTRRSSDLADAPARRELERLGHVGGVPLGAALVDPAQEVVAVLFLQAAVVAELAVLGVGVPRRHAVVADRSEEHTSELQSLTNLVCRLLLE